MYYRYNEGPDAREDRPGLGDIQDGFCVDHNVEGVGKLCTVGAVHVDEFSRPIASKALWFFKH